MGNMMMMMTVLLLSPLLLLLLLLNRARLGMLCTPRASTWRRQCSLNCMIQTAIQPQSAMQSGG
jgi:hypothetical protein